MARASTLGAAASRGGPPRASLLSDRALVLQKGQVVLAGTSAELRDSPQLASYLGV